HSFPTRRSSDLDAAQRRLMIEQDAAGGVQAKAFPVVHGDPVTIQLGHAIGAAGVEGRRLVLTLRLNQAEHLAGGGLIEARLGRELPNGLKYVGNAEPVDNAGRHRLVPGTADKALCAEVVDLVGARLDHRTLDGASVSQIPLYVLDVIGDAQLAQSPAGIRAASRDQAVDSVSLVEQQFCGVSAILASNTGNQCVLVHCCCEFLSSQSLSTS